MNIDIAYLKDCLHQLLTQPSPAGMTAAKMDWIAQQLQAMGCVCEPTRTGGLKVWISPETEPQRRQSPKRLLSAHVDTLGAMVSELKPNGRLSVLPIGSWSSRMAENCRVKLHCDSGAVYSGTLLPLKASVHASSKEVDEQPVKWEQLEIRVDALAWDKADLEKLGIQVGNLVSIDAQTEILDNGFVISRFLDDLGGVACLLSAVKTLQQQGQQPAEASMLLFTASEEQGYGAAMNLPASLEEMVAVDIAIVAPGQHSREDQLSVVYMDNSGPFHPQLTRQLETLARAEQLPVCRDVFKYYFSDCAPALQAGNDLRHALIGFGTDASHGFERTHLQALEATVKLIVAYLRSPLQA